MKKNGFYHVLYILLGILCYFIYLYAKSGFYGFTFIVISCFGYGLVVPKVYEAIESKENKINYIIFIDLLLAYIFANTFNLFIARKIPILFFLLPVIVKNFRNSKQSKILLLVSLILVFLVGIYFPIIKYNAPYKVLEKTIELAKSNGEYKNEVTDEEFKYYDEIYDKFEKFNFNELKRIVNSSDKISYKHKTSLINKLSVHDYSREHIIIYYYDNKARKFNHSKTILIYKIDGKWKIVGQRN